MVGIYKTTRQNLQTDSWYLGICIASRDTKNLSKYMAIFTEIFQIQIFIEHFCC